jgi:flagellar biosynthesis protein FliQ
MDTVNNPIWFGDTLGIVPEATAAMVIMWYGRLICGGWMGEWMMDFFVQTAGVSFPMCGED